MILDLEPVGLQSQEPSGYPCIRVLHMAEPLKSSVISLKHNANISTFCSAPQWSDDAKVFACPQEGVLSACTKFGSKL